MNPFFAQVSVKVGEFDFASQPGYAIGWGTLALLNAGLAQAKNRSGLLWWLVSLLLGPIATFVLVAFCDKVEDPERTLTPRIAQRT